MANWISATFHHDGLDLHYVRTGGDKPPLILLHGLAASGACWTPFARLFEDEYDVVMPDARGHGKSGAPLHGYGYQDHARDVVALISQLGLSAPILLGHSMGGMTAATVAGEGLQELTSVILADPTFIGPELQRDVRDSDVVDQHRRVLRLDKAAVSAELRDRHPNRSSEVVELLAAARLETRLSAFDVLTPPYPDYIPLARMFQMPVLLVVADAGVVSLETPQHLETVNPRIETSYVQHAGHGLPFDSPERLAAAVRPFLFERTS